MTDDSKSSHAQRDPVLAVQVDLVRGKEESEIAHGLIESGHDPASAARLIEEAKHALLDPAVLKNTQVYVAQVAFLETLRAQLKGLISDEEPQSPLPAAKTADIHSPLSDDERHIRFLGQAVAIHHLLGWSEVQSRSALATFGLTDQQAGSLIEAVMRDRERLTESERQLERTMFQLTRRAIEQGLDKGKTDEELIAKVRRGGWNEETAWYFVKAFKVTQSLGPMRPAAEAHAISRVQQAMYYGYPLVLPPSPQWETLPAEEQLKMKGWERRLQDWRNRPVSLGLLVFCVLAPYFGWLVTLILSVSLTAILGALFTIWHSQIADTGLSRVGPILVILGLLFLGAQVLMGAVTFLAAVAGVLAVYFGGLLVSILARGVVWRLRT